MKFYQHLKCSDPSSYQTEALQWQEQNLQKSALLQLVLKLHPNQHSTIRPNQITQLQKHNYITYWKDGTKIQKGGKGSGVWPSMVTHTRNLSSAFNPSKCTLTAVNTHPEQWAAMLRRPGSSWGIGALLKGLTSVMVLRVERALVIHSPHRQSLPDLGIEPATFGLQVRLSNH